MIKILTGGSPCTHWSIAQTQNRETEAKGLGWELFKNYLIALEKYNPDYFLYENNKSMAPAIREQITKELGVEPILINSSLLSAQNRQRYYWTNIPGVGQPEDRGILLKDILETGTDLTQNRKSYCLTASYDGAVAWNTIERSQRSMVAEPVNVTIDGKARTIRATCYKDGIRNLVGNNVDRKTCVAEPVSVRCRGREVDGDVIGKWEARTDKKNGTLTANAVGCMVAEPVCVAQRGRYSDTGKRCVKGEGVIEQFYEARADGKTNALTTVQKDNAVAEPVCMRYERSEKAKKLRKQYEAGKIKHGFRELSELHPRTDGKTNTLSTVLKDNQICEPIRIGCMPSPDGTIKNSQGMRLYSVDGKAVNQTANGGGMGAKTGLYAVPYEYIDYTPRKNSHIVINENAIRCAQDKNNASVAESFVNFSDVKIGTITTAHVPKCIESADKHKKAQPIYEVKDGQITIKGKRYPIKLADGYYIIRKLTVTECMKLQTVPEWFEFPVSNTQAYKMLGNGWTIEVIKHILSHIPNYKNHDFEVLSMYDGMACAHIALKEMGVNISKYYATEIDKWAIQTSSHNFPDIVHLGDAFQVREDDWRI